MNYMNTAIQLSITAVICVSFSILAFSLLLNREKSLSRLLGMSFSITFLIAVFTVINRNTPMSVSLFSFAQGSLLLSIFIILAAKPKSKSHGLANTLILFYTILAIILMTSSNIFYKFITAPTVSTVFIIISSLLVMFILRKEKDNKSVLFWGIIDFTNSEYF